MSLCNFTRDGYQFQCVAPRCTCRRGKTRQRSTIRCMTFFKNRNIEFHKVLFILYAFLTDTSSKVIHQQANVSLPTVYKLRDEYHLLLSVAVPLQDLRIGKLYCQNRCRLRVNR